MIYALTNLLAKLNAEGCGCSADCRCSDACTCKRDRPCNDGCACAR